MRFLRVMALALLVGTCAVEPLAAAEDPDAPAAAAVADPAPAPPAPAVSPDMIQDPTAFALVQHAPAFLLQLIPFLLAFMLAARGLSEALLFIGAKTQNATETKAGQALAAVAQVLGTALSYFGIGTPKAVVMAKAEAQALKEGTGGPSAAA